MPKSTTFCLILHFTDLAGRTARIINEPVDLFTVTIKYYKFFSKAKAKILALHHLYNL